MILDSTAHSVLLAVHIVAGSAGLVLGPVAIVRETGRLAAGALGNPAGRSGKAYDAAVLVVCVSAVLLVALFRTDLWWLIPVSGVSYGLVVLAGSAATRRPRGWIHAYAHGRGGSYIALFTAFVVVGLTVEGSLRGGVALIPWLTPTLIGTVLIESWRRRLTRLTALAAVRLLDGGRTA